MHCPHENCGKEFGQLAMLVDNSKIPRDTYYACPYCKSKINVQFDRKSLRFKKRARRFGGDKSNECSHHFGYLKLFYSGDQIPEECMMCPRLIECSDKKL